MENLFSGVVLAENNSRNGALPGAALVDGRFGLRTGVIV
jgi:hypothetical protein